MVAHVGVQRAKLGPAHIIKASRAGDGLAVHAGALDGALVEDQQGTAVVVADGAIRRIGAVRVIHLRVGDGPAEGIDLVAGAHAVDAVAVGVCRVFAEAVQARERQVADVRADIFDGILHAQVVVAIVVVADVHAVTGDDHRAQQILDGFILAAQGQGALVIARQAHVRLAAEQTAALRRRARHHIKTVFQHEDGLGAVAQVFLAAEADTGILIRAAQRMRAAAVTLIRHIADTGRQQAIHLHAALRLRRALRRQQATHHHRSRHPFVHRRHPKKNKP